MPLLSEAFIACGFHRGRWENRSFMPRIAIASSAVIVLAIMIGHPAIRIPYAIHSSTPTRNIVYVDAEIAWAERVRQIRNNCGKNDAVVSTAAVLPRKSATGLEAIVMG